MRFKSAGEARIGQQIVGDQQFARRDPGKLGPCRIRLDRDHLKSSGRDIRPGDADQRTIPGTGKRGQIIVGARVEQRVFGQRARRHEPHDGPGDHRFAAALAGFGRVLDLLADGDLEPFADQLLKIGFVGVHGHAAHGDIFAQMLAAFGQRDVEGPGGGHRIVEEELLEIAHAVEQQRAGMGLLDLHILGHHGRDVAGRSGDRFGDELEDGIIQVFMRHGPGH